MENFTILNYQGSKNNLSSFIKKNIEPYIQDGKAILDIFSGSAAVSNIFRDNYQVYANDVEYYASIIADAMLNQTDIISASDMIHSFDLEYTSAIRKLAKPIIDYIEYEQQALDDENYEELTALYNSYPTVWNNFYSEITKGPLTVDTIKETGDFYLFATYYATNYYGIIQSLDIDCIIKIINTHFMQYKSALLSCLFFAMKEAVFSKDGHMAQPLSLEKNQNRLFMQRKKNIYDLFVRKFKEYIGVPLSKFSGKNVIFNSDFEELLDEKIFSNVGLVYADPPYTDMQYSRYYHLLNVAAKYEYPALTITKSGYTKGLYTEGRYQSKLSQRSSARQSLENLIDFCSHTHTNLAISYAYPQNREKQATDRYTISIDELVELAQKYYTSARVNVVTQKYNHANHRNSEPKKVIEYLILCGDKNLSQVNIESLKKMLGDLVPNKNNAMYNSHIYWSQKAFNICDALIDALSNRGDVIFDPFLGSGVTALEAIKADLSRCAIGCDINDMPLFISKLLLSVNTIPNIKSELENFISELNFLTRYYETTCPMCKQTGTISKVIFDKPERTGSKIIIKAINYTCKCTKKGIKSADDEDYARMNTLPKMKNIGDTALVCNTKIAVTENDDIKNIFTGRNLSVLDEILGIIHNRDEEYQPILKYILMSILHLCKITDRHSNSQWPLWIPKTDCVEKNIIDIYIKKIRKFYAIIPFMKEHYADAGIVESYDALVSGKCLLLQKGSQFITEKDIPDNGVDLIITDPPYLEQVLYSEYMQLYKPFLNLDYNLSDEIVVSSAPSRSKNRSDYFYLLEQVFRICSRKLKPNHYLCLYFHDSDLTVWNELIAILERNCFRFITQIHIDKNVTLKNIISPKKSLNGDSVLIFLKDNVPIKHNSEENISEIEHNIIRQAKFMVKSNGSLSTPELYDNGLMEILIQNGWLAKFSNKYSSLVDLFDKHLTWDSSTAKWK
ncbi:MAG: DNA adenine methylase [Butyrivibrio sp.]|nr:DNA adenine methylase [Acetatifactor muris]MCM1559404.1 DNA adenine methylase [Butyrivibrio sp.]